MAFTDMSGVALIAGAGSGIGQETGLLFAERGARAVAFADINLPAAESAAARSRTLATHPEYTALAVSIDTSDRPSVRAAVAEVLAAFGRIDYFVNSAGIEPKTKFLIDTGDLDEFDRAHAVNTRGVLVATGAVATAMKAQEERVVEGRSGRRGAGRGAIVNMASIAGHSAMAGAVQYGASKWGCIGVTKAAAKELNGTGVRVNCLCPGWAETPMLDRMTELAPDLRGMIKNNSPMERGAFVEEIAAVSHFLCSPDASYVHGVDWVVDGGFKLK